MRQEQVLIRVGFVDIISIISIIVPSIVVIVVIIIVIIPPSAHTPVLLYWPHRLLFSD